MLVVSFHEHSNSFITFNPSFRRKSCCHKTIINSVDNNYLTSVGFAIHILGFDVKSQGIDDVGLINVYREVRIAVKVYRAIGKVTLKDT